MKTKNCVFLFVFVLSKRRVGRRGRYKKNVFLVWKKIVFFYTSRYESFSLDIWSGLRKSARTYGRDWKILSPLFPSKFVWKNQIFFDDNEMGMDKPPFPSLLYVKIT